MSPRGSVPSVQEVVDLLNRALPKGSDRLAHTLAVGRLAAAIGEAFGVTDPARLVAAAYLHDVGYAEAATETGMHQLDGARFLRGLGYDDDLCRLVAHHTFAQIEARNKGLADALWAEFPQPDGDLEDLLDLVTFCDLSTSSTGESVDVGERFAGIYARYPAGHVVAVTMREVEPSARDVVARVGARLDAAVGATNVKVAR